MYCDKCLKSAQDSAGSAAVLSACTMRLSAGDPFWFLLDFTDEKASNTGMTIVFTGAISCKSVLENHHREARQLYVDQAKRSRDFAYIIAVARQKQVPVETLRRDTFRERFPNAGGIALEASSRHFPDLTQVEAFYGLIVYVSGIEDPYNLGSTVRSLYAAGASLLILPRRDWSSAEPVLQKASAGAWDKMTICMIDEDQQLKDWASRCHLPLVCAARDNAVSLFDFTYPQSCVLVIGGALRGISRTLLEGTRHVYIPYGREFRNALDTPSAAAVMAFAWTRQQIDGHGRPLE